MGERLLPAGWGSPVGPTFSSRRPLYDAREREITHPMPSKDAIRDHWNEEPCGSRGLDPAGEAFFEATERERRRLEGGLIGPFADFAGARGKRVLEIGVGTGCDFVQWVRAGAEAHGVDLTPAGIDLTRRRLAREGRSADLQVADAEDLPFPDDHFDRVYSWGVLHHTPDPPRAFREVLRVLKPGGEARIMVYHRRSWVVMQLWVRWGLLGGDLGKSPRRIVRERLESPGTEAYRLDEIPALLDGFTAVEAHPRLTAYDLRQTRPNAGKHGWWLPALAMAIYPRPLVRALGDRFGFFLLIRARKPTCTDRP